MPLAVILIISCGEQKPPDVVIENNEYQQMMKETAQRDSAMMELVKTLNLIDQNIEKISDREKQLKLNTDDVENRQTYREKILEEIEEIYTIMQQNKDKIDQLNLRLADTRKRLNKTDKELKHANELIIQYQVMIDNMTGKMNKKDEEIYLMKEELAKMDISLDSLKEEFVKQHEEMNVVHYAFGNRKELIEHKVINKSGGFIGLGKSMKISSDFNKEYFTQADAEELESIELFVKKATLLSTHREGSYHFEMKDEKIEKLIIDDKVSFWEASKFLVIEVEQ